jgi:dihydroorotase-like cyclic amidohydrolase
MMADMSVLLLRDETIRNEKERSNCKSNPWKKNEIKRV